MRRESIVSRPESSSRVPAALAQLNLNVTAVGSMPLALRMCSSGHENGLVRASSQSKNGSQWIWASAKTPMMIRYGEKATSISPALSRLTRPSGVAPARRSASLVKRRWSTSVSPPAMAGRGPAGAARTSPGRHTCSSATIAAADSSEATMSVSSTER
jgi:hypothetical protein